MEKQTLRWLRRLDYNIVQKPFFGTTFIISAIDNSSFREKDRLRKPFGLEAKSSYEEVKNVLGEPDDFDSFDTIIEGYNIYIVGRIRSLEIIVEHYRLIFVMLIQYKL